MSDFLTQNGEISLNLQNLLFNDMMLVEFSD